MEEDIVISLRPYQQKIVNSTVKQLTSSGKALIVLPTGGGKTQIISFILRTINKNAIVVAHTKDLINQLKKMIFGNFPELSRKVEIATIQSFTRNRCDIGDAEFLIIDEAHRACSNSYQKLITAMGPTALILGATATPFRNDKKSVYTIFGFPDETISLINLIEDGYLSDLEGYRVMTNTKLNGVKRSNGDFTPGSLSHVINCRDRNQIIVKEYKNISPREKAVAFCVSVQHGHELAKEFQANGISSDVIHGQLGDADRTRLLSDFKRGKIKVLCNCQLLTEGFDEPSITTLLMCRPTLSKGLYVQMIGRGTRIFPGKEVCKVIEFTDNIFDVCSLETLMDGCPIKFKLIQGERFSKGLKRMEQLLEESDGTTIVEKEIIIPKTIYERPASIYQKQLLQKMNIPFQEPLTEFMANHLLGV